ncbi:hypothetical protein Dvina_39580 [Dactylosporangium vinaceum]|uniref:Integral membrane protein n=1 Tax=Dactylosporangium vinaceum TaxID=53362 RepID=A0ABV5M8I6_9ACTN|nr:hypothetical protein [Dactylosporangium vinaceum]UAB94217.1 hypothetical protein Dvina_39580 [Dactylosporangium vinaceum]
MAAALQADPVRTRITRPGSGARTAAAVVVALTLAALGAGFGALLGWLGAPDLPTDDVAAAIVAPAVPVAADGTAAVVTVSGRLGGLYDYEHPSGAWTWLVGDDDYTAGSVWLTTPAGEDGASTVRMIGDALTAQGWRVTDDPGTGQVSAVHGQLTLRVYSLGDDSSTVLRLSRTQPGRVWPLAVLGYLAGLAAGWLGGRRFAGGPTPARVAGWAGVILLLPGTALTTAGLVHDAVARVADGTPPALWGAYLSSGVRLLSTTGIALLAGAVALAASARVGRSVRKRRS